MFNLFTAIVGIISHSQAVRYCDSKAVTAKTDTEALHYLQTRDITVDRIAFPIYTMGAIKAKRFGTKMLFAQMALVSGTNVFKGSTIKKFGYGDLLGDERRRVEIEAIRMPDYNKAVAQMNLDKFEYWADAARMFTRFVPAVIKKDDEELQEIDNWLNTEGFNSNKINTSFLDFVNKNKS